MPSYCQENYPQLEAEAGGNRNFTPVFPFYTSKCLLVVFYSPNSQKK